MGKRDDMEQTSKEINCVVRQHNDSEHFNCVTSLKNDQLQKNVSNGIALVCNNCVVVEVHE